MIDGYVYKQTAINAICQDWCGTSNENCKNPFDTTTDDCFFCDGCGDVELIKALPSADVQQSKPGQLVDGVLERNIDNIRQAGLEGKEFRFRIGGRLFAVRELPQ